MSDIKLLAFGFMLLMGLTFPLQANEEIRVLVLLSLDVTYPYVKSKVDGLAFEGARQPNTILLDIQSIEDQRFTEPHQLHNYFSAKAEQFRNSKPDLILISGSPIIFDFYNNYIYPLMPDIPMVGETRSVPVNHKPPAYSFIEYAQNMPQTIDMALSATKPKHIYLIGDATHPGSSLSMDMVAKSFPPDIDIPVERLDMPFSQLLGKVASLPGDSVGFYNLIFTDGEGNRMIPEKALEKISRVASFPVFAFHETMIGSGATGGMVAKGEDVGIQLLQEGLLALKSGPFNPPRIVPAKSTLLFDWQLMQKNGVDIDKLPPHIEIIGKQATLLEAHFYEFISGIAIIIIQGIMMLILILKVRQNKSLTQELEQTLLLQEERIHERTHELKKTTDRLGGLFDSLNAGVVVHNADTSIVLSNSKANQVLGFVSKQIIGHPAKETQWHFTDKKGKHQVLKNYPVKKVIKSGRPLKDYVMSLGEEDKASTTWLLVNGMPIYDNNGNVSEVVISFVDITRLKQSERAFARTSSQLSAMFESREDVIYVADPESYELLYINPQFKKTWGDPDNKKCYQVIQGNDRPCSFCTNDKILGENTGKTYRWEYQNRISGNWYRCVDKAIEWDDQRMVRFEIATNINEERAINAKLKQAATVFANTYEGIIITDLTPTILDVNQSFTEITGYNREEAIGKNPNMLKSYKHDANFYRDMWKSIAETGKWKGEIWNRSKDGAIYPELLHISSIPDDNGEPQGYVAAFSDITSIKQTQQRLDYLAHHDALTDLPNRLLFDERLKQSIRQAKRHNTGLAVAFIDLDRFKNINDTLGHHAGDELLQQVSIRLKLAVREGDTVARISGDEFVMILEDVNSQQDAETVIVKIMRAFQHHVLIKSNEVCVSCSIGISLFPQHGDNFEEIMRNADIAMYRTKQGGRNAYLFYSPEMVS
jgi:diguanylate cyclase (GGDEF)-like protein/PAS domain S-box-containing protein